MTNKEAFKVYYKDDSRAEFVLTSKLIDPTLSDAVSISGAWGMIERATDADYKQGSTSETLSNAARQTLIANAKAILSQAGINYNPQQPTVKSSTW